MCIYPFPPSRESLETPAILRALIPAHRHLAELEGVARAIPNQGLLLTTLALQEAQSNSEIENIVTTQDALLRHRLQPEDSDAASKEVARYVEATRVGLERVRERELLTSNTIVAIQAELERSDAGFRSVPGTVLRNERTGEVVSEPPSPEQLPAMMGELERFLNEPQGIDPLVSMALAHHRFESIHPFYDGNGRTGRIVNILYLVKEGLLDMPSLYLSRYINQTKDDYYRLLRDVRDEQDWEPWILYMLRGVAVAAAHTAQLVEAIRALLMEIKQKVRANHRFYSQDLLNNIFRHPYTKIAFLQADLGVSRQTAARYLDALTDDGILTKDRLGRESYYMNKGLVALLFEMPDLEL